jgi:hypothetical protein
MEVNMSECKATIENAERAIEVLHNFFKSNGVPLPPPFDPDCEMLKGPRYVQHLLVVREADNLQEIFLTEFIKLRKDMRDHLTATQPATLDAMVKLEARMGKLLPPDRGPITAPEEDSGNSVLEKLMHAQPGRERAEALLREARR